MQARPIDGHDATAAVLAGNPGPVLEAIRAGRPVSSGATSAIFHAALRHRSWQEVFDEGFPLMAVNLQIFAPEHPGLARSPGWAAQAISRAVAAWEGDQLQEDFALAMDRHDLPRVVLYLLSGLRPRNPEVVSYRAAITAFVTRYSTGHGRVALHHDAGSLEDLFASCMQNRVQEIWPGFPTYDNTTEEWDNCA